MNQEPVGHESSPSDAEALELVSALAAARLHQRHERTLSLYWEVRPWLLRNALHLLLPVAEAASEAAIAVGDLQALIDTRQCSGVALIHSGRFSQADEPLRDALTLARRLGDMQAEARALAVLGQREAQLGDVSAGITFLEEALERYERVGDERGVAQGHGDLANQFDRLGDTERSLFHYEEATGRFAAQELWGDVAKVQRDAFIALRGSAAPKALAHALVGVAADNKTGAAARADSLLWEAASWAAEAASDAYPDFEGLAGWHVDGLVAEAGPLRPELAARVAVLRLFESPPEAWEAVVSEHPDVVGEDAEALLRSAAALAVAQGYAAEAMAHQAAADAVRSIREDGARQAAARHRASLEEMTAIDRVQPFGLGEVLDRVHQASEDEAVAILDAVAASPSGTDEVVYAIARGFRGLLRLQGWDHADDRWDRLEAAITDLESAVGSLGPRLAACYWLLFSAELGSAYRRRQGRRETNYELAIACLQRAVDAGVPFNRLTASVVLRCRGNLANALVFRVGGDRAENVERAIALYETGVVPFADLLDANPAQIMMNLGLAYAARRRGARLDDEIRAHVLYYQAAGMTRAEDDPGLMAAILENLGMLYRRRGSGDPVGNHEIAVHHFRAAAELHASAGDRLASAKVTADFATSLAERPFGDRRANLDDAISTMTDAVARLEACDASYDTAGAYNNLGIMHLDLAELIEDRAEAIDRATGCLRRARERWPREEFPLEWSRVTHNLGSAELGRERLGDDAAVARAAALFRAALEVRTRDEHPELWAESAGGLAAALRVMDPLSGTRDAQHLYEAIEAEYRSAGLTRMRVGALEQLAQLATEGGRHDEALERYREALDAVHDVYTAAVRPASQLRVLEEYRPLFMDAARSALAADDPFRAVAFVERSRARLLGEARDRIAVDLEALAGAAPDLHDRFVELAARVRETSRLRGSDLRPLRSDAVDLAAWGDAADARAAMMSVITSIRQIPGFEAFVAEPDDASLEEVFSERGPVAYILDFEDALVFLVCRGNADGIRVDVFRADEQATSELFEAMLGGPDGNVENSILALHLEPSESVSPDFDALTEAMGRAVPEHLWHLLESEAMETVHLVPLHLLALLPWHAAHRDGRKTRVIDLCNIAYVPSARVLARVGTGTFVDGAPALVVGDPDGGRPLPGARAEAIAVAGRIRRAALLVGGEATRSAVLDALENAVLVHFAGHGRYVPDEPLESGIGLADGALTMDDVIRLDAMRDMRLVVLSGCQTGVVDLLAPGQEALGLATAFVSAGADAVVASLWKVSDAATQLLMERFYDALGRNRSAVQALAEAQRSLRAEAPVEDWAGFVCIGV